MAIRGDVSQSADWVAALDTALPNFRGLDIVEEYDRIVKVDVKQHLWSTKVVVPYLIKNGKPRAFVNVSSMGGMWPRPNLIWYAASKGAVNSATKGLAAECATAKIRFNAILPAVRETNMTPLCLGYDDSPEAWGKMISSIPLGRLCQPHNVADAACFL
ncbi:related to 3-oxoacyl-(acyl carrier protein) reductase [Fusarium torulosum]|uniref:Related to 3-oxoacyl-(Acyl carrier protein) reductase n=1 Tax=Fusarium torulosum TaxID=33205 RepID=A0AAE8MMH8_9HYPO|nr:related to 3-oxoacyl-(acyl carrier protein) reductase [Fusarium torulosum]